MMCVCVWLLLEAIIREWGESGSLLMEDWREREVYHHPCRDQRLHTGITALVLGTDAGRSVCVCLFVWMCVCMSVCFNVCVCVSVCDNDCLFMYVNDCLVYGEWRLTH